MVLLPLADLDHFGFWRVPGFLGEIDQSFIEFLVYIYPRNNYRGRHLLFFMLNIYRYPIYQISNPEFLQNIGEIKKS